MDDVRIYNYFYFLKFFYGKRAFFSGYKSMYKLGKTTFDVKIQMILNKTAIHDALCFFLMMF